MSFLDNATDGLRRGEIWIIAGKSGGGKTSLALQIAKSFSDDTKNNILFISLEMKGYELVTRLFCGMYGVNFSDYRKGFKIENFEEKDKSFIEYITSIGFEISEYKGYKFKEIEEIIVEGYVDYKPDVIFIDFIQIIDKMGFKDERHAMMEYIRKLKELAKKYNIGVVVISQLRRLPSGSNYNREPDMMDLLGTSTIEQVADKVVLCYKAIKNGDEQWFIKLAKNRQGMLVKSPVRFEGQFYQFVEYNFTEIKKIMEEFQCELL